MIILFLSVCYHLRSLEERFFERYFQQHGGHFPHLHHWCGKNYLRLKAYEPIPVILIIGSQLILWMCLAFMQYCFFTCFLRVNQESTICIFSNLQNTKKEIKNTFFVINVNITSPFILSIQKIMFTYIIYVYNVWFCGPPPSPPLHVRKSILTSRVTLKIPKRRFLRMRNFFSQKIKMVAPITKI